MIAVVDHILTEAVRRRARNVHIEPFETTTRIRLRIDGALQTLITLPRRFHSAVVGRLEAMSSGGRLLFTTSQGQGRYQMGIGQTVHGQAVSLRALGVELLSLSDSELTREQQERLERVVSLPNGLVVVAGPKDAGRTTFAATLVETVARSERQIVTVSRHGSLGISGALCFTPDRLDDALAQDPDIVLLDDVSVERLTVAAEAALDGRLVIATTAGNRAIPMLHTLTTLGSTWRFAATLQAVVSVRLLRRTCENCAIGLDLAPSVRREEFGLPDAASSGELFRKGKGCGTCWGTGYHGRALLAETVFLNSAMRESLLVGTDEAELMELAREDASIPCGSWVSSQQYKGRRWMRYGRSCRRGDEAGGFYLHILKRSESLVVDLQIMFLTKEIETPLNTLLAVSCPMGA